MARARISFKYKSIFKDFHELEERVMYLENFLMHNQQQWLIYI